MSLEKLRKAGALGTAVVAGACFPATDHSPKHQHDWAVSCEHEGELHASMNQGNGDYAIACPHAVSRARENGVPMCIDFVADEFERKHPHKKVTDSGTTLGAVIYLHTEAR